MENLTTIGENRVITIDTSNGGRIKLHDSLPDAEEYVRREYPGDYIDKVYIMVGNIYQVEVITEEE